MLNDLLAGKNTDTVSPWERRHNDALRAPNAKERPIRDMLESWHDYATNHYNMFDSLIGEDYVLGVAWQSIGESIRTLLNGECGRLDCGTVDSFILKTLADNGINTDNL
jgi:hypothetical protein